MKRIIVVLAALAAMAPAVASAQHRSNWVQFRDVAEAGLAVGTAVGLARLAACGIGGGCRSAAAPVYGYPTPMYQGPVQVPVPVYVPRRQVGWCGPLPLYEGQACVITTR